jgi:hypothetical protein
MTTDDEPGTHEPDMADATAVSGGRTAGSVVVARVASFHVATVGGDYPPTGVLMEL